MENKLPITVAENVYLGSTEEETGMPLSDVLEGVVIAVEEVFTDYDPNLFRPTLNIGTVTTVSPTTPASVVNSGTDHDVILDFDLPKGDTGAKGVKGDTGDAATIAVGTVTTGNPTHPAAVVNVGTTSAAVLDFTIPKGETGSTGIQGPEGAAATIAIGTVTTGAPGDNASVVNAGTAAAAILNFIIPKGNTGVGIASIARTSGNGAAGTTDIYTITFTDSTTTTFPVYQGANGTGIGDMLSSTYDIDGNGIVDNAEKVNNHTVEADVPSGAQFTDTITTINGKTGTIAKADIVALGIPAQDTVYTHPSGTNQQLTTKSDVGLGNVTNDKQMPISGGVLENYTEKLTTVSASGGSINLSLGNVFQHTPSGNRTYSITNAVSGVAHSFTLIVTMGSTVRTLTFPASVKWQGGEIPDMTTPSKTYILTFLTVNGGITWLGMFGGEF